MRHNPLLLGLLALVMFVPAPARAFHEGGVGSCSGCHLMHVDGPENALARKGAGGNAFLLKEGTATDTCLACHAQYGQFRGGEGYGPGGDFHWLTRSFSWTDEDGSAESSPGDAHGHNVLSPNHGIDADGELTSAPGGDFLSSRLGCTSCHDPHGNANFRMLYGKGAGPTYGGSLRYAFAAEAPRAEGNGPHTYAGGDGEETDTRHTIYAGGMSAWCANCHATFHSPGATTLIHPSGEALGSTIAANYNAYVSGEDPFSGSRSNAYAGLVPYEAVTVDLASVDPSYFAEGPGGTDEIMCLSCHRAHASPFADIGRWDFGATFLLRDSHPRAGDAGASPADVAHRYYGYRFVERQRSLCNKCHGKDAHDAPPSS